MRSLSTTVAGFAIQAGPGDDPEAIALRVRAVVDASDTTHVVLLSIPATDQGLGPLLTAANRAGARGVWIRGETQTDGERCLGAPVVQHVRDAVVAARAELGLAAIIIAGGVIEPADVGLFMDAGANLVAIDAGLPLAGPGLPKRCNEYLLQKRIDPPSTDLEEFSLGAARSAWFWAFWLGLAMLGGGLLAMRIATSRVVLPYDESLCGMTRGQLASLNPRLLPFMAHDRVTLGPAAPVAVPGDRPEPASTDVGPATA